MTLQEDSTQLSGRGEVVSRMHLHPSAARAGTTAPAAGTEARAVAGTPTGARHWPGHAWRGLAGAAAAGVAASVVVASTGQQYDAAAQILLRPPGSTGVQPSGSGDPERDIQTQVQLVLSRPVAALVRQRLGEAPPVAVAPLGRTDILELTATASSAGRAAEVANAYAAAYLAYYEQASTAGRLAAETRLTSEQRKLSERVVDLDGQLAEASGATRTRLLADRAAVEAQLALYARRLADLRLDATLGDSRPAVLARALPPGSGERADPVATVVAAALGGLALTAGLSLAAQVRRRRRTDAHDSAGHD